ncbi:dTDP-4-dehydrorhamnose 3,5-epimerase family protein [Blastococcus saxobsidens]|uniref:dTDP-4-dehydrorhamnose 3,5-epimerase n=1 Tax=Blastococcus saxobsidens (strain DD2) TaxID=1146883 RepID=H6RN19_BLASD|nr:dTDP-4-dehydrorhamnose 3,5-epimerase [Blastococcus saxobsidens]CCG01372.1 dTDP-4-dehydrorhamnose 3,5-epimerase [Blastococcus saxobsidens DD2]
MKFTPQAVDGVHLVEMEPHSDERGFFARSFAAEEFEAHGLQSAVAHANVSFNHRAGTMRGLHLSLPGHPESKFVRCTRGAIVDVAVDIRPGSPTYLQHVAVELSADNRAGLYLPAHVAHAYLTLTDDTEVLYMVSVPYAAGAEIGYRYDDPAFGIPWPREVSVISDKDAAWPAFDHAANAAAFAAGVDS